MLPQALEYSVQGTVCDDRSGKPVAAATVTIPGQGHSTVTNEDGVFVIKSDAPISTLSFSCIGYRNTSLRAENGMKVRLIPAIYPLKEASIISGDPREIVLSAIEEIPSNYVDKAELLQCFYRETIRKRQRYISVNEAVSKMYKTGYKWRTSSADRTAIEKSRVIMSQRPQDTLSVLMVGGPYYALELDAVKNPDVIFNPTDLPMYEFKMESPAYIGDRLHFVISFKPVMVADYPLFFGRLYIDRESLAFSRMELSLDMSNPDKARRVMLLRKPAGLRFTPKEQSIVINYRSSDGGPMRLDYFRTTTAFSCDWKKRLLATNYTVVNELVVTGRKEPAEQIPRSEMFHSSDILQKEAKFFLDPDFWKDYNIIEASESLEHAAGRLLKRAE